MRNFDKSYIQMAEIWAQNSRAIRAKVGALIVKDNMIISDGFNGTPSGFENECETIECTNLSDRGFGEAYGISCGRKPELHRCHDSNCCFCKLTTKPYVLHAEANAITKLSKCHNSADGATLYVTLSPCLECAKLIIQAGIKRVVYKDEYRLLDGIDLLRKAGIIVEKIQ